MPAFTTLPTDSIWQIITYLRSLNTNAAGGDETVPGDVATGERIFWGKGGCGTCHEVNARGGSVGPDLSAAGNNSAAHLRNVILDPKQHGEQRTAQLGNRAARASGPKTAPGSAESYVLKIVTICFLRMPQEPCIASINATSSKKLRNMIR